MKGEKRRGWKTCCGLVGQRSRGGKSGGHEPVKPASLTGRKKGISFGLRSKEMQVQGNYRRSQKGKFKCFVFVLNTQKYADRWRWA